MSDAALRRVEQALATRPDAAELHRQRAEQLTRLGRDEAALAALDLAWRLGADEVFSDLQERLAERMVEVRGITLHYVPGGPFVMGRDDHDADAAPSHLVELSPFYVAAGPIPWGSLRGWDGTPDWVDDGNDWFWSRRFDAQTWRRPIPEMIQSALGYLDRVGQPEGLAGSYQLPSEAQWERVFRSCYLVRDGVCPYGAEQPAEPEWIRDHYDASYYERSPLRDPVGPERGELQVVRGIDVVPQPHFASFREAARSTDGAFPVGRRLLRERWVRREEGLAVRVVFEPA